MQALSSYWFKITGVWILDTDHEWWGEYIQFGR